MQWVSEPALVKISGMLLSHELRGGNAQGSSSHAMLQATFKSQCFGQTFAHFWENKSGLARNLLYIQRIADISENHEPGSSNLDAPWRHKQNVSLS